MEFDNMPEPFEGDLEEFERNQVAADREHEEFELDDETPLGHAIEEGGLCSAQHKPTYAEPSVMLSERTDPAAGLKLATIGADWTSSA